MAVMGIVGTVLLTLLKIVLILLLLVLVIVLLVLFVPVRYKVCLEKQEEFSARARVSWLCRLVSFRVLYEQGEPEFTLRVLGINILKWLQRRRERSGEDSGEMEEADISMAEIDFSEYSEEDGEDKPEGDTMDESPPAETGIDENLSKEGRIEESLRFFRTVAERIRRFWREIMRRLRGIADFFKGLRGIADKIRRRAEWLGELRDFVRSENTRQMVCIFRDNVLHLWRKLKPETVKGQVWFGTGDPCSTGQILGVCAMLFACYGNGVAITPDFERKILEGKLMLKGHLSLITVVVILVKVFFSRQWKTFRREWDVIGGSLNE